MVLRIVRAFAFAVLAAWFGNGSAVAQDAAVPFAESNSAIVLAGEVIAAATLVRQALAAMPQVEREVSFSTSKGEKRGRYAGVLLRTVFERAGLWRGCERHAELRRTFLVTGRDGYEITFSVGEIAADFGDAPIMIALAVDGAPLPAEEGLRLIAPGDRRGARNVYDVVRIEVR